MSTADTESSQLQAGIAALEAQRPILGDVAQESAHDFAAPGFWQIRREHD
mgnify:CR=1 FL=1